MVQTVTAKTVLAFDTSGPACAVALLQNGQVAVQVDDMAKGQAEHLMPMLERILQQAGLSWADLDAIGVGIGPGNFTGIRISVSAARGLALGLKIPVVGVSFFDTTRALSGSTQTSVPAPRGQDYFDDPDQTGKPILRPDVEGKTAAPSSSDYTMADHIAQIAHISAMRAAPQYPSPAPLYIRAADAAPPRDAPPVILP